MVANPLAEIRREHVGHPQAAPGGFIRISRTDAASGGADIAFTAGSFKGFIQRLVGGGDEVSGIRDAQALSRGGNSHLVESFHFLKQGARIDDHAVAQDRHHLRVDDARGDEVQFENAFSHRNSVTGIVATIIAGVKISPTANQSTIRPLPSSPHWAPTMICSGIGSSSRKAVGLYQSQTSAV